MILSLLCIVAVTGTGTDEQRSQLDLKRIEIVKEALRLQAGKGLFLNKLRVVAKEDKTRRGADVEFSWPDAKEIGAGPPRGRNDKHWIQVGGVDRLRTVSTDESLVMAAIGEHRKIDVLNGDFAVSRRVISALDSIPDLDSVVVLQMHSLGKWRAILTDGEKVIQSEVVIEVHQCIRRDTLYVWLDETGRLIKVIRGHLPPP